MKKYLVTLGILAAMLLPAQADAVVEDLLVRRSGDNVNLRVTLRNPSPTRQEGPVAIDLSVRANENDQWTFIKNWNDIEFIAPNYKVSRDFFDENSTVLKSLAKQGRFQVRAVVHAPGLKDSAEKTSWYDSKTGQ